MANTKVQSEQIEDGAITAAKIADGAIVASEVADNAITTAKINADAVTGAKIADNAIDSEHYTDGSIDTAHIADSQVTSAKIDTNIDIAGTFDVTGATVLDSTLTVDTTTLVVDATNNRVGIGIASPASALHIDQPSNDRAGGLYIERNGSSYGLSAFVNSGGYGVIGSNGGFTTDILKLDLNTGKVGIGTDPATLLHINGAGDAIKVESTNTGSGGAQVDLLHYTTSPADDDIHALINMGGYTSGTSSAYGSSIRSVWSDVSAKEAQLEFFTRDDSDFAARMIIDKDGNVGIGDSSPSRKFTVKSAGANATQMSLIDNDSTNEVMAIGQQSDGDGFFALGQDDGTTTVLFDGSGDNYITSGDLGIGTDNPSALLHATGSSTGLVGDFTNTNTSGYGLRVTTYGTGAQYGLAVDSYGGGYTRDFTVGADGNVNVLTGNLVIGTAGKGIDFSATSGTGSSELLDDYEEGAWTPSVVGATTSINDAHYVKIGSFVYINTYLNFSSLPSDGTVFKISGLPYATHPNSTYGGGTISYAHTSNVADMTPLTQTGDSYIYFHELDGNSATVTRATWYGRSGSAGYILLNMHYMTNF